MASRIRLPGACCFAFLLVRNPKVSIGKDFYVPELFGRNNEPFVSAKKGIDNILIRSRGLLEQLAETACLTVCRVEFNNSGLADHVKIIYFPPKGLTFPKRRALVVAASLLGSMPFSNSVRYSGEL